MLLCTDVPRWIKEIPGHLKTQEMSLEAVRMEPYPLAFFPDHFKKEEMCLGAVQINSMHTRICTRQLQDG